MNYLRLHTHLLFFLVFLTSACGSPDEGYLAFRLVWPEGEKASLSRNESVHPSAEYQNVVNIRASLLDSTIVVVCQSTPYYRHEGEMSAPPGTYLLRIEGLNINDTVMYRGEESNVRVRGGSTTEVGEILMQPVP